MTTQQTQAPTRIPVTGKYGELWTDEPEQILIEQVRDYLAQYRPNKFIPNWNEMAITDQITCLRACVNSVLYLSQNVISHPEIRVLLSRLPCVTNHTDAEPNNPTAFLTDFQEQADRAVPAWKDLPGLLRRRFTDYYHHSVTLRKTGKLSWLDVEMMLAFAMTQGLFLTPASFDNFQAKPA